MKRILAVFLCILMLLPICILTASAECVCDDIPVIYVKGRSSIYEDKDLQGSPDLPYVEDGYIEELVKELLPVFAEGYMKNDLTEWEQKLTEAFDKIYSNFSPDENGVMPGNSGVHWCPTPEYIGDRHKGAVYEGTAACNEYLYRYTFTYDCRRPITDVADDLKVYIDSVKKVTGHDKVNIISRCLGTCVATAYFAEYGWEGVETFILYNPTVNGTFVTNTLFTGNVSLGADALDYFANQELGDETVMEFLKSTVTLANKNYSLGLTTLALNNLISDIAKDIIPGIMKVTYGTMGGYWAMVSGECYEEARDYIFKGEEEKYSYLIGKFDEYYNNVGSRLEEIYTSMEDDGVNVKVVAKYGFQLYPLTKTANEQSDKIITLKEQTFGAHSADFGEKLSKKYIEEKMSEGKDVYISPDKVCDASTALFPDTTWIIKDLEHNCFPHSVDVLLMNLFKDGGSMTVWSNENYPQYMVYTPDVDENDSISNAVGAITSMTEENPGVVTQKPNFFEILINFFRNLFKLLSELLNK